MRYFLEISYDGSKFNGFQRLKKEASVQSTIENALLFLFKEKVEIKGAGRTDRGVHAYGQCCHFDLNKDMDSDKLRYILNNRLKPYIYINSCKKVSENIHARHSVRLKKYSYKINIGKYDPLKEDYYYQPSNQLDINAMKKASKIFLGTHNFQNFISGSRENYETTINKIEFKKDKETLIISFCGIGFYKYMVRHLVGALIDVGNHKKNINDIKKAILHPANKENFTLATPNGLYLDKIWY